MTTAHPHAGESAVVGWLRGGPSDRTRYVAMAARLQQAAHLTASVVAVKVLAAFWYGPGLLVLIGVAGVTMALGIRLHRRARHPEVVAAVSFVALQLVTAATVYVSGGAASPLLPLLAVPVFCQAICFRPPVFLAGVLLSAAIAVPAVLLGPELPASPPVVHLAGYLALLVNVAGAGHQLLSADRDSRDEAVVDPMTGLYNRLTLSARFAEAQRDAELAGGSVGLVMVDVDHFKTINDTHGHERGDRVLLELADRLRGALRSSDLAYRVGGEEFVVLLPGRDAAGAGRVAERIRRSVESAPLAGLRVTVSAGAVSTRGDQGTLAQLLRRADTALYEAKDAGRNRVAAA